jgi:NAD(P)-dependent dehydrogenase (short-subunit alcohol dehydrogenase family)
MDTTRFEGSTAVVVGAASGIGAATVLQLLAEGSHVAAVDRNPGGLQALAQRASARPRRLATMIADAMDETSLRAAFDALPAAWPALGVLVNAVGGSMIRPGKGRSDLEDMELADWQGVVDFNLNATFLACKIAIPRMKRHGHGSIVNLASISAHGRGRANAAYVASKAGVIALTRKLSFELGPAGIRCNAVVPGLTLSERVVADFATQEPGAQERAQALIPLRRLGLPEEQAQAICFLASGDASFITGVALDVSGGQ